MRKTITLLTILLFVVFMVGCENSVNPIVSDNPNTNIAQAGNTMGALPFGGGESSIIVNRNVLKPPKPSNKPNAWNVPGDFGTIQEANDAPEVLDGDIIYVSEGEHDGALIDKGVQIIGQAGKTIINFGPELKTYGLYQGFRFHPGSDGAIIKHITFTTDFGIMTEEGISNIEISHCEFLNTLQGISAWGGSGWNMHHNNIIDLRVMGGGGIGILIGSSTGIIAENNIISQNKITGTLSVISGSDFNGSGIVLYADFRWGRAGAQLIQNNKVEHNTVSLISDTPEIINVVGCELTDTRDDGSLIIIKNNTITKNDFRGTTISEVVLTPELLINFNDILKNHIN